MTNDTYDPLHTLILVILFYRLKIFTQQVEQTDESRFLG